MTKSQTIATIAVLTLLATGWLTLITGWLLGIWTADDMHLPSRLVWTGATTIVAAIPFMLALGTFSPAPEGKA